MPRPGGSRFPRKPRELSPAEIRAFRGEQIFAIINALENIAKVHAAAEKLATTPEKLATTPIPPSIIAATHRSVIVDALQNLKDHLSTSDRHWGQLDELEQLLKQGDFENFEKKFGVLKRELLGN